MIYNYLLHLVGLDLTSGSPGFNPGGKSAKKSIVYATLFVVFHTISNNFPIPAQAGWRNLTSPTPHIRY